MTNIQSITFLGTFDLIKESFNFKELRSSGSYERLIIQKL